MHRSIAPTPSLTATLPLKNDAWKAILSFWDGKNFREMNCEKLRQKVHNKNSEKKNSPYDDVLTNSQQIQAGAFPLVLSKASANF